MKNKVNTIFGPPGTGKTKTLVDIAQMESERVNRILMLSYTKAAAEEAGSRVDDKVVKASTIHSLAYNALGVGRSSVVDGKKLAEFGDACGIPFASQSTGDYEQQEGDEYMAVLAFARNRLSDPWEAYDHFGRPGQHDRFKMFFEAYPKWKHTYGYIDFDDMLERLPTATCPAYPVVILDEAQDCSPLQWRAFESVAKRADRVYIAGDDDQAIYEWGGADPHGMADFSKLHGSGFKVLAQSHRVPKSVLALAKNTILTQMGRRVEKKFAPMENEGTVTRYGDLWDYDFNRLKDEKIGSSMILVRDRWRMKEMQKLLHEEYIPYTMNGAGPYENKWANAVRAVMKLNQGSEVSEHERQALINCGDATTSKDAQDRRLLPIGSRRWQDCLTVPAYLREFYDNADLFASASVALSTIHGSKGREADNVLVDLTLSTRVEQSLYLDKDAELRVMYVAVTRAKENLILFGSNPLL
jgi:DNA helicase-2/ATP-dependent DNA helicase PcrA